MISRYLIVRYELFVCWREMFDVGCMILIGCGSESVVALQGLRREGQETHLEDGR